MTIAVSKTQEKKAARLSEAQDFVKQRRVRNLEIFESNFEVGLKVYEDNKDKLTPEQVTEMEAEIERNRALIKDYKERWLA
jgi:hypothetical protein